MIHRAPVRPHGALLRRADRALRRRVPDLARPEQVRVLPISEKSNEYAQKVEADLKAAGFRVTLDFRGKGGGENSCCPNGEDSRACWVKIGAKEADSQQVTIRHRSRGDLGSVTLDTFVARVVEEIATPRALMAPSPARNADLPDHPEPGGTSPIPTSPNDSGFPTIHTHRGGLTL